MLAPGRLIKFMPEPDLPAIGLVCVCPVGHRAISTPLMKWQDPMRPTLFGIPNCDTMKKARAWLDGRHVEYRFHDYKKDGIRKETLEAWVAELGWESLLNRKGTTFRKLPDSQKADLDAAKAINLMCAQPSMIRRPVLDIGDRRVVGFSPQAYAALF